jgi:hypothetical protein
MSVTIVNDYFFKPDGNIQEGKEAATDLIKYFTDEVPEVQLSLWLESQENPLHHYHITVFDNEETVKEIRESKAIETFIGRLFPQIDHSTYISPLCNVWLSDGPGVKKVK